MTALSKWGSRRAQSHESDSFDNIRFFALGDPGLMRPDRS